MNITFIKAFLSKILPLVVAFMIGLYILIHPPGRPYILEQLPTIQTFKLPPITLKEEKGYLPSIPLRNPFLSSTFSLQAEKASPQKQEEHHLTMVLLGRRKSCIIDGKIVKEGELVSKGFRVIRILEKGVWIEENGRKSFIAISPYK